jgi:hypothetical protein
MIFESLCLSRFRPYSRSGTACISDAIIKVLPRAYSPWISSEYWPDALCPPPGQFAPGQLFSAVGLGTLGAGCRPSHYVDAPVVLP